MVTNSLLRIEFVKVVDSEIFVRFIVAQHAVDGYEETMLNRADSAFFSTAAC